MFSSTVKRQSPACAGVMVAVALVVLPTWASAGEATAADDPQPRATQSGDNLLAEPDDRPPRVASYVEELDVVEIVDDYTLESTRDEPLDHSLRTTLHNDPLPKWLYERDADSDKLDKPDVEPIPFDLNRAAELLEDAGWTDERREILHELHAVIHDEQPCTFFYAPRQVAVWNDRLENVQFQQIRPQTYSLPWYIDP